MRQRKGNLRKHILVLFGSLILLILPQNARSHCDTLEGPVLKDAQVALDRGDVAPVLKWVKEEDEEEIRHAFQKTLEVRKQSKGARELADQYFFETLVRVHRAGEGEPYTGLKEEGAVGPAEKAADGALAAGSVDSLARKISEKAAQGIRERFVRVAKAKEHAEKDVTAGRKYVEAYVEYVHYVLGLHNAITSKGGHLHEED